MEYLYIIPTNYAFQRDDTTFSTRLWVRFRTIQCEICSVKCGSETSFCPCNSVHSCQYYSNRSLHSSSCYSYQKDKRENTANLQIH